jgi:hypothetical protein
VIPRADFEPACEALEAWAARAQLQPGEPIFRAVNNRHVIATERLTAHSVSRIVKRAMRDIARKRGKTIEEAKETVRRFSGHSLRAGFVTSAAAVDVPPLRIAQHTRHKSLEMVMPPPAVLDALRKPRRPQLGDPRVKRLLAKWKQAGRPIEYGDLWEVAALLGFERSRENIVILGRPDAKTRRKIVAAVEAAGIKIRNLDAERRRIAETGRSASYHPRAVLRRIEESRWRWPEKWDARPPLPPRPAAEVEWALDWEYGPTLKGFQHQERFRQEKFPWLDGRVHVKRARHVDALRPEELKPGDVVHKALQLPENQEEKGSGIRVLVRRGIEECIVLAEELHEGDVVVAWPAHDEATEKRAREIETAIRDRLKELRAEDKPE